MAVIALFVEIVRAGPVATPLTVMIPHGTSTHGIGDMLESQGAVDHSLVFRIAAKGICNNVLRAGEYEISAGQSIADIVLMMHDGRSVVHKFTIAEGLTSAQILRLLKDSTAMSGDVGTEPADGTLLPETYLYSYGDTRLGMLMRMEKNMQITLADLWAKRDPAALVSSPAEAVTMASVIEKETGKATERPRIAGVFYNRLKQKMRPAVRSHSHLCHHPGQRLSRS